jgi:hypothetical protein
MDSDADTDSDSDSYHSAEEYEPDEDSASEVNDDVDDEDVAIEWQAAQAGDDRSLQPHSTAFIGFHGLSEAFDAPENVETGIREILELFLPECLLQRLCQWTNTRVEQEKEKLEVDEAEPWKVKNWKPCTLLEMKKFVGILLFMGIVKKPNIALYWSTDPFYYHPIFHEKLCLPKHRFQQILSWVRTYDCTDCDETDPLCKIRPFLVEVQRICKNSYKPRREISVDETLVLFKGRLQFRQYLPNKKAKSGIKLYCAAESATGYVWNIAVHSTAAQNQLFGADVPRMPISERIVVELIRELLDQGYHLFCDSWFASVRLAEYLLTRQTLLTCTIRQDRGVPLCLRQTQLRPPGNAFTRRGRVLAIKVVDRRRSGTKTVYMLDTAGTAEVVQARRMTRNGEVQHVEKPASALAYNRSMGGLDRMDAACQPYNSARRTQKWFIKLLMHLLLVLVRNSFVAYRHLGGSRPFLHYLESCVRQLLQQTGDGRVRVLHAAAAPLRAPLHVPRRLPPTEKQPRPAKRCRICYAGRNEEQRRHVKYTVYFCPDCADQPGLCLGDCFVEWHRNH